MKKGELFHWGHQPLMVFQILVCYAIRVRKAHPRQLVTLTCIVHLPMTQSLAGLTRQVLPIPEAAGGVGIQRIALRSLFHSFEDCRPGINVSMGLTESGDEPLTTPTAGKVEFRSTT